MSADHDGDSQMVSSSDESELATPSTQMINSAALSPPDSQHRDPAPRFAMPTVPSGASIANSNGKRPLHNISNGNDDQDDVVVHGAGKSRQDGPEQTHQGSGYTWSRQEDEPGYSWMNKKAQDELQRALDQLVHRHAAIKDRYGDPFEAVEKERAITASLKQS